MFKNRFTALAIGTATLVACNGPAVNPESVSTQTSDLAGSVAVDVLDAANTVADLETWVALQGAFEIFNQAFADFLPDLSITTTPTGGGSPPPPPAFITDGTGSGGAPFPTGPDMTPEQMKLALKMALQTFIFNDANLESNDDTSATFILRGELLCSAAPTTSCVTNCSATGS